MEDFFKNLREFFTGFKEGETQNSADNITRWGENRSDTVTLQSATAKDKQDLDNRISTWTDNDAGKDRNMIYQPFSYQDDGNRYGMIVTPAWDENKVLEVYTDDGQDITNSNQAIDFINSIKDKKLYVSGKKRANDMYTSYLGDSQDRTRDKALKWMDMVRNSYTQRVNQKQQHAQDRANRMQMNTPQTVNVPQSGRGL